MGIELPGVNVGDEASGRKSLPPAGEMAQQKPAVLVSMRKAKDFWGLQSVPEVSATAAKVTAPPLQLPPVSLISSNPPPDP